MDQEGLVALANMCHYQRFRTMYASQTFEYPFAGTMHAPISAATFSVRRRYFSMTDLCTDFVRDLATFRQRRGLRCKAARLSIRLVVANDIHSGQGGCVRGSGGGLKDLTAWNFVSDTLMYMAACRERGNVCLPWRNREWHCIGCWSRSAHTVNWYE